MIVTQGSGISSHFMGFPPSKMSDLPIDGLLQRNNTIHKGRKRRCGMRECKKATKKAPSTKAGQALPARILVAEDNKAIGDLVSKILDFMGFEVALAVNGVEALSLFIERSFDLVLTDLEMPIMDGWGLTYCIKERSPSTPVVLMTGADRESVLREVERGPVDSVLFKPFRVEDLQSTVRGALSFREGEFGSVGMEKGSRYRVESWISHSSASNQRDGSERCGKTR
jgi:CheY-like chemotaxis protein